MTFEAIHYTVSAPNPNNHLFHVELSLTMNKSDQLILSLPTWIPGSYLIRDFAKNILNFKVSTKKNAHICRKLNKTSWKIKSTEPIRVSYDVFAWDASIRSAFLDNKSAFFNGTSLFLRPEGLEKTQYILKVTKPDSSKINWALATGAKASLKDKSGFGTYKFKDYDDLVDHPFLLGELTTLEFEANNVPHKIVVLGKTEGDLERLTDDVQKVCQSQQDFFNDKSPFDEYSFLLRLEENAYGGLEHRNSSALIHTPDSLPLNNKSTETSESYKSLLGLFSHEYFHSWNVKKMKPQSFTPYDYAKENYTELLWFFEGFTSYYDDLFLIRSKVITTEQYLELLSKTISSVQQTKGRLKQSVADASFNAWIHLYQRNENTPNACISYYSKGSLIALCLDIMIRFQFNGKKSLDTVMNMLWANEKQANFKSGLSEAIIYEALNSLDPTFAAFLKKAVHSSDELPLQKLLAKVGIECDFISDTNKSNYFGIQYPTGSAKQSLAVSFVANESPAEKCGIAPNDEIIALNETRVDTTNFEQVLKRFTPEKEIFIHAFRKDKLYQTRVKLEKPVASICKLKPSNKPNKTSASLALSWLNP